MQFGLVDALREKTGPSEVSAELATMHAGLGPWEGIAGAWDSRHPYGEWEEEGEERGVQHVCKNDIVSDDPENCHDKGYRAAKRARRE